MKRALLREIMNAAERLTFVNPFSDERASLEEALLSKLENVVPEFSGRENFTERFARLLPWLGAAEKRLIELAERGRLNDDWKERASFFAFFVLYHELVPDLDLLIESGADEPGRNRSLFRRVQEGIAARHVLIEGVADQIWNRPEHLFACFYQLRRAFIYIDREIIGKSRPMRQLRAQVWESVFTHDMMSYQRWMYDSVGRFPSLVLGPSGSGKELVARAIGLSRFVPYDSKSGSFASNPAGDFSPVNLSALSETLLESELFGHRKGAFTGAFGDRKGLFATCGDYGSVFLDEIGEVTESTQVKLLRLLQSGEFQAIGENSRQTFSGKIIAATHKDLVREMEAGRFREDFYYRLCGDQITTVALSDILKESPEEFSHSVSFICQKLIGDDGAAKISERVLHQLESSVPKGYSWPGNFRELEQAVRNCIVRGQYQAVVRREADESVQEVYERGSLSLAEWNQIYARKVFEDAGSYRETARRLRVDQRTAKKLVEAS